MTDIKTIPDSELIKLSGLKLLIVNALQKKEHLTHMNLKEALSLIEKVKPQKAYLTHLNHHFGLHKDEEPLLPENVFIAYDTLKVEV